MHIAVSDRVFCLLKERQGQPRVFYQHAAATLPLKTATIAGDLSPSGERRRVPRFQCTGDDPHEACRSSPKLGLTRDLRNRGDSIVVSTEYAFDHRIAARVEFPSEVGAGRNFRPSHIQ